MLSKLSLVAWSWGVKKGRSEEEKGNAKLIGDEVSTEENICFEIVIWTAIWILIIAGCTMHLDVLATCAIISSCKENEP